MPIEPFDAALARSGEGAPLPVIDADPGPFVLGESDRPLRAGARRYAPPAGVRAALTDEERRRYARVMVSMPFAGDLRDVHVEYVGDILDVLERFAERLYEHSGHDAERKEELSDLRHDVAAVGRMFKRALTAAEQWQAEE